MAVPEDITAQYPGLNEWCILHAWRGSIAHGMYDGPHPDSIDDKDTMAICVPSHDYYFGLREFGSRGTQEIKLGEWDIVVYEARKAIRMLAQGNPNIISMLWLPDNLYIEVTSGGRLLLDNRELFVGQWCYQSFVGYANGQFHKMTHGSTQGYMGEKRRALVEKYGYDCKNAAHLIRLLRMACEFLKTGEMIVDRGGLDATELLDIKHGEWSLAQVQSEAERLFRRAEDAYDRSILPLTPDLDAVNALAVAVVNEQLSRSTEQPTRR